jgi:glycosyltransferase involved in cell wall biosynthesis
VTDVELLNTGQDQVSRPGAAVPAGDRAPETAFEHRVSAAARLEKTAARALEIGLRRLSILAWRDLDDPEAGGSELHAHQIASIWAGAGLDVRLRSSAVAGMSAHAARDGYRVVRKGGRITVFPRAVLSGLAGRGGRPDGVMEIWHGMPFFSPLWTRCPRVSFVHHVHAETWRVILSPQLARVGEIVELRLAPHVYRRARIVTVSESSRQDLVTLVRLDPSRITVVPNGVDAMYRPDGERSADPLVVAVGRLVPVKRFELLLDALIAARRSVPRLRAVIVGEGVERPRLEAKIAAAGATEWIELPGRVPDADLLDYYRRAWVLASTSQREGWNMTITEAAACGAPAVATDIVGHRDTVADGESGLLAPPGDAFTDALVRVLRDEGLRSRLGAGALARARALTWESTATGALNALIDEALSRG